MYLYKVFKKDSYRKYSTTFKTKKEALNWYKNKGLFLEKILNRKLFLFKDLNII